MKRQFPVTLYTWGHQATVIGADEEFEHAGNWHCVGTYATPDELGSALLEWIGGGTLDAER